MMNKMLLLACVLLVHCVCATHFRGGTLSWRRSNATSRSVTFRVVMHFFTGGIFPRTQDVQINYGDGSANSPSSAASFLNGTFDASGTIRTIVYEVNKTYATLGAFVAYIGSSARQHAIINGPDRPYRIEAGVNLPAPACLGNPAGVIPGVAYLAIAPAAKFQISPSTTTAQQLSYSWFGSSGLVKNPPQAPAGSLAAVSPAVPSFYGVIVSWNTSSGVAGSLYAVSVRSDIVSVPACFAVWDVTVQLENIAIPTCTGGSGSATVFTNQATTRSFSASGTNLTASLIGELPPGATLTPGLANGGARTSQVEFSWLAPTAGSYAFSVEFCNLAGMCGACSYSVNVNNALPQVDAVVSGAPSSSSSTGGLGTNYTYTVTVENTSLQVPTLLVTSVTSSLDGSLAAYGCPVNVSLAQGSTYTCSYTSVLTSTEPNLICVQAEAAGSGAVQSVAADCAAPLVVVTTTTAAPTTTTRTSTTTSTTTSVTAAGQTTVPTTTTVPLPPTTPAPTFPPRSMCGKAVPGPCLSDADCGESDARPGRCVGGFCQCGLGWRGIGTDLDPRKCEPICVPPPLPDALTFLKEANISSSAEDGMLVLRVGVSPYLKQRPTSIWMQHPVTETICNVLPSKLGLCELKQVVDGVTCVTEYIWTHPFYDAVTNSGCFVELPSTTETGPGLRIISRSFQTVYAVDLEGFGPFGLEAGSNGTTSVGGGDAPLRRTVRRLYTFTVATRLEMESDDFTVAAGGRILYRLVGLDVQPTANCVLMTVQTRVARGGRISPLRINRTETVGMPNVVRDVSQGPCVNTTSPAGGLMCDQFHTVVFDLQPCQADGVVVVNAGLSCDEPSLTNPVDCGFAGVSLDSVYALRFLQVRYNACPVTTVYGVDPTVSFVRLYSNVPRTTVVTTPVPFGTPLYGRVSVKPSGTAQFQAATLASLWLKRRTLPADVNVEDLLSQSALTLLSLRTSTSRENAVWDFELLVDGGALFTSGQQYYLEATIDVVFLQTGTLKRIPQRQVNVVYMSLRNDDAGVKTREGLFSQSFLIESDERSSGGNPAISGSSASSGGGVSVGILAGVIGATIALAIAIAIIVFILKRRRHQKLVASHSDAPIV